MLMPEPGWVVHSARPCNVALHTAQDGRHQRHCLTCGGATVVRRLEHDPVPSLLVQSQAGHVYVLGLHELR